MLKATLIVGGVGLLVVGAVIGAQALGTLLLTGALSPWLLPIGGVKFFEVLVGPVGWLVGGSVIALVGLGLVIGGLNVHRTPRKDTSAGS